MKPLDYSKLKETRVTLPAIALLGLVLIGWKFDNLTVDYLDDFFVTKALAEEQYTELSETVTEMQTSIQETNVFVLTHINEYKLNQNATETRSISNELYNLELYVAANGESELTRNRKRDLQNQLQTLGRVRACIVHNVTMPKDQRRNCDAII